MVGLSPPPPPPPQQPQSPVGPQHSPPPPHTAEAAALTEQKPPPPQQLQQQPQQNQQADQHASGTEHHAQGYQGGGGGGGGGGYPHAQNYPVLLPQSYLRTTDCNPCNNVPWIPMSRAQAGVGPAAPQDSYGPPAAGEAWGQASDAVPLAQAPIPFPSLHKGPLPPIFQADDFTRVQPDPPTQPVGLHDHLVPPTPEHDSVVFTINEEHNEQPVVEANNEVGDGVGELKSAPGDQLHQGTLQYNVGHGVDYSGGQNGGHGGAHNGGHNHHVPHLAHHNAPVIHHVPPPLNSVHQQPYSASAAKGALGGGVELVQSVPIASYLASIEYPMTFIQSPLIEIPVKSVPVPHGFVQPQPQHQSLPQPIPLPLPVPQPQPQLQAQHQAYQIVAPTPGESQHGARLADSAPASSASIQHHNYPPCRHYAAAMAAAAAAGHGNDVLGHHHHEDAATANSQNSHAYAQELGHFESQRVTATPAASPTAAAAPNNYRLLEDGAASSAWPSTSEAPPTSSWDASAAATVTANGASGYSAPSGPSASGPSAPAGKGGKKTKQIQIIVPYTIDKESGQVSGDRDLCDLCGRRSSRMTTITLLQVRLHSELMPEELSGVGAESEGILSYTPPPDLPPSAAGALPSGLEALVQQTARKVPQSVVQEHQQHQQHQQPQAQESVVVAELSPTPWQAGAAGPHDKGAAPSPTDPFAGLQHILATDLRTLLRNEEDSVDRLRLQKNIDNWTAQVSGR
ncbi:hypothetical protein ONE63_005306 [Megalurothrips usitatus]|uniref:Trithorax group protein osa-like n=1 Tax=Megalurothrips usitatus TaxID=439358 RepID=A0AAV7Y185_9NEOP|nr:hypothetical protein ONE63_005306 [Megalurothrips usitatus]